MGEAADLAATAHTFNKILAQPKLSSKTRSPEDVEESVKKLRRLILIDGIPSKAVCSLTSLCSVSMCCVYSFAGPYVALQDLENFAQGQRVARRNIPRIRREGAMRGQGEDSQ